MSSAVLAALLAAAAVLALGLPRAGAVRLSAVSAQAPGHRPPRGPRWSPDRRVLVLAAAALPALAAGLAVGPVPALLAGAGGALLHRHRAAARAASARRAERVRMVQACTSLAAELRAGRTPDQALTAAAGLASGGSRRALAAAGAAAGFGGDVGTALAPRPGDAAPEVQRALAACWSVCAGSGSGLASAVERLEAGLRADAERRRAVDAELAGPRATAGLLAVLPVAGLILASGLGADPLHVLLFTPVGLVCLTLGLTLDVLGLWWTGAMVARAGGRG